MACQSQSFALKVGQGQKTIPYQIEDWTSRAAKHLAPPWQPYQSSMMLLTSPDAASSMTRHALLSSAQCCVKKIPKSGTRRQSKLWYLMRARDLKDSNICVRPNSDMFLAQLVCHNAASCLAAVVRDCHEICFAIEFIEAPLAHG